MDRELFSIKIVCLLFIFIVYNSYSQVNNKVYWIDKGLNEINKCDLDGANRERLFLDLDDIAYSRIHNNKVYWTQPLQGVMRRSNLNGTDIENVMINLENPQGFRFYEDKIFWIDKDEDVIKSADMDGTQIIDIRSIPDSQYSSDIFIYNDRIYFFSNDRLKSIKVDGSQLTTHFYSNLLNDSYTIKDIVIHQDKVYWRRESFVFRANLDGTSVETVHSNNAINTYAPRSLNISNGKLYFDGVETITGGVRYHVVEMNLDGSSIRTFYTLEQGVNNVSIENLIVDGNEVIFFEHKFMDNIAMNLMRRGTIQETPLTTVIRGIDLYTAYSLYVTETNVYWRGSSGICMSDLNGDNVLKISDSESITNFFIYNGKKYYTSGSDDAVKSSNLDGTNVQELAYAGVNSNPTGIHVHNDLIYWTNYVNGDGSVSKMSLDGSNLQTILTESSIPGFNPRVLHIEDDLLFMKSKSREVSVSNLDGSSYSNVFTIPSSSTFSDMDVTANRDIYWSTYTYGSSSTDIPKIQRTNLDGSFVGNVVVSDIVKPTSIFVTYDSVWANLDDDNDTILNGDDNCPSTPNTNQIDSDSNGIGDACEVLSIDDFLAEGLVSVYPNPVNNRMNLSFDNSIHVNKVELFDMLGKVVVSLSNDLTFVDMSNLSNGMYFVKVTAEEGVLTKRIIKE